MIQERETKLDIEVEKIPRKSSDVFYNERMIFNRDISIACLKAFSDDVELTICDALSGSGVRGIRYLKKIENVNKVIFNDLNPRAIEKIKINLKLNGIDERKYEIKRKDANILLLENRKKFDFIDIDPFGSPIFYIDSCAKALKNFSSIGLTATDTAVLSGAYKKTCIRRYCSIPLRNEYSHETGLRILIKAIFEIFARHDMSFEPLLSFYKDHYFRIFAKVIKSAKRANRNLKNMGYLSHCNACNFRILDSNKKDLCPYCNSKLLHAGPLWIGNFSDRNFSKKVSEILREWNYEDVEKFVRIISNECEINVPFYHIHQLSKILKTSAVRRDILIEKIAELGYKSTRTHFSSLGIRTNCPVDQIHSIFKELKEK